MAGADQRPGRRRAVPEPKRRKPRGRDAHRGGSSEDSRTDLRPVPPAPEPAPAPAPEPAVERTSETPRVRIASKPTPGTRRATKPGRDAPPPRERRSSRHQERYEPAAPHGSDLLEAPARRATAVPADDELSSDPHPSPADLVPPALPEPGHSPQPGRVSRWSRGLVAVLWLLVTGAGLAGVVSAWVPVDLPAVVPSVGSVTVTTTFAFALGVRTGGRPLVSALLAAALGGAAVGTGMPVLLAAATVSTTVLGAVLGVLVTTPASRFPQVVRECLVAVLVAVIAAFAASGYGAQISVPRAGYLTLGLAMLGALALVYRLGAGLAGLGTRGAIMVVGGIGLLAVTLAYTAALARWGPPGLVSGIEDGTAQLRTLIGAVPRPTEFLVGIPVLAWGVFSRARRRQGWWGAGFGAAGLGAIATSLLNPSLSLVEFGLGLGYNVLLGLLLGLLVIRADTFLSGTRGRRARQAEEAQAHRPEPGRLHPLL